MLKCTLNFKEDPEVEADDESDEVEDEVEVEYQDSAQKLKMVKELAEKTKSSVRKAVDRTQRALEEVDANPGDVIESQKVIRKIKKEVIEAFEQEKFAREKMEQLQKDQLSKAQRTIRAHLEKIKRALEMVVKAQKKLENEDAAHEAGKSKKRQVSRRAIARNARLSKVKGIPAVTTELVVPEGKNLDYSEWTTKDTANWIKKIMNPASSEKADKELFCGKYRGEIVKLLIDNDHKTVNIKLFSNFNFKKLRKFAIRIDEENQ